MEKVKIIIFIMSFHSYYFFFSVANSVSLPTYLLQLMSTQKSPSIVEISKAIFDNVQQEVFTKGTEKFYIVG